MKRSAKSITKAILTAAALLVVAFIYNGAEADAGMSKPLEKGQYFQAGTCTTTVMTGEQQIKPRDNMFGDKFGYHGEYYYNGSDHREEGPEERHIQTQDHSHLRRK